MYSAVRPCYVMKDNVFIVNSAAFPNQFRAALQNSPYEQRVFNELYGDAFRRDDVAA